MKSISQLYQIIPKSYPAWHQGWCKAMNVAGGDHQSNCSCQVAVDFYIQLPLSTLANLFPFIICLFSQLWWDEGG